MMLFAQIVWYLHFILRIKVNNQWPTIDYSEKIFSG
jgi:hypothetical protein